MSRINLANALTATRLLLAGPFAVLMAQEGASSAALAALVLALAIVTDVLDGLVARHRGTTSAAGRVFDHLTDCLFVTCGLAAGASRGVFPWPLPILVAAAFAQYVADSHWWHRGSTLRASALGRWNGVFYFAPLVGDVLVRLGLGVLRPAVTVVAWALVASTLVSMGDRLLALTRARASHAGGTRGRPPR